MLKRIPKRYQDVVLWAWREFFSLLRGNNSKMTHYLLAVILFLAQTLEGTVKALTVDLLRLHILRGTKTVGLTVKSYDDKAPVLFI